MDRILAFVGVSVAVVVVPGPDMALVARNVLRDGRRAGYATTLGVCTGILGWALVAGVGVSAILATSSVAFTVLKLAGAAYLIYLGIATLRAPDLVLSRAAGGGAGWRRAWSQGLVSALLNPKLGVFFMTLLPQFVSPGDGHLVAVLMLAVLFDVIGLAWLLLFSSIIGVVCSAWERPTPRRVLRWLSGGLLVGLGARLALERS